jgi:transcription antitermination factor NusG
VVEPGNVVEICAGPMIGFKGIVTKVVDHDVYIETLIFGRSAPVRINIAHLTKLVSENEEKKAE